MPDLSLADDGKLNLNGNDLHTGERIEGSIRRAGVCLFILAWDRSALASLIHRTKLCRLPDLNKPSVSLQNMRHG